jgi:hypothetical protein
MGWAWASPSSGGAWLLAVAALFVALADTATAAVIISSPDQLAGNVITSPKIVDGAVAQSDERNPSLTSCSPADPLTRQSRPG